ncbi:hypothetical protein PHYBOEH_007737 [Phytophthora boehmeriae]|uniref:Uncharacterized protein n=1 Tax=Phytophthora boehmeriae TaxID=109152 RepID=A0A8T1X2C9_9STRA|nr:hypothetical protein PHYBOEH_007737 [Phytophthora boehmeriae]
MKGAKTDVDWFSPEELAAAREEYLEEQEKEQPSPQVKLRYAIALAKSRKRDDKYRAIGLLEEDGVVGVGIVGAVVVAGLALKFLLKR